MKKVLCLLMAVLMVASFAGCEKSAGGTTATAAPTAAAATAAPAATTAPAATAAGSALPADGPEFKFTIGTSATKDSIIGQTMQKLADLVNERSGGKITVDTFPDGQLGSDSELVEGVQMGTITMVIGTTAPQVAFVPDLALFDLPNVYTDITAAQKVLVSFKDKMAPSFEGTDLHLATMFPTVFRYMSCSKAVRSINDFAGIKIRTMENKYHMAYWNALGATATPLAFSELYIGLQQGLVDAQENPLDIFMSSKFYEQQDYVINTKHIAFIATILMNEEQWKALPAEYQALMNGCFADASEFGSTNAKSVEDANKQKILDEGVEIIELDDATFAAMIEKAKPVYDMIRESVGSELVDEYLAAIQAAK